MCPGPLQSPLMLALRLVHRKVTVYEDPIRTLSVAVTARFSSAAPNCDGHFRRAALAPPGNRTVRDTRFTPAATKMTTGSGVTQWLRLRAEGCRILRWEDGTYRANSAKGRHSAQYMGYCAG
jgi:hypothetical protein